MEPSGWWPVLLDGLIGAGVGGVVAALTAWWVVRESDRRQAARAHDRVIRERVAGIVSTVAMIPDADVDERLAAYWRSHGATMALVVELRNRHQPMRQWLLGTDQRLFRAVAQWESLVDPAQVAADINGALVTWSSQGLPPEPPERPSGHVAE